jgi:hypothetical protein
MKRVMVALIAGTILSGLAAAYASATLPQPSAAVAKH